MRRTSFARAALGALALAGLVAAGPALADPPPGSIPNFMPALYADDELWGTKGTTELPAPNDHNHQSFDALYVITNSNTTEGLQLPVGEAAPGNPDYNGGRWDTHTVTWTMAGFMEYGYVPLLTSYADIIDNYNDGYLTITEGSPGGPGAPPDYFQCPLLPVLDEE
jgi:hypothetical protein